MLRIELMDWSAARVDASRIRLKVFVEEQRVPAEIEMDDNDAGCVHALAYWQGRAVGTGRLLPDGHIGRMAVLKDWRGRGIGALMLNSLMQRAKERGYTEVALSAQVQAVPFYRAHGFTPEGDEYLEAGIKHQAMKRRL